LGGDTSKNTGELKIRDPRRADGAGDVSQAYLLGPVVEVQLGMSGKFTLSVGLTTPFSAGVPVSNHDANWLPTGQPPWGSE
jgi:hypothetical protein